MSREACPFESPDCKYFNLDTGCFSDIHHFQRPKADYKTRVEKEFRELDENKWQICREIHDEIHANVADPLKPSLDVMRHAINQERINRIMGAVNNV